MKRLKPIIGISLLLQSLTFLVLCLVNIEKKKNLAAVFGVFSAIGGVAGATILAVDYKERKDMFYEDIDEDFYYDDDFDDFEEDDLIEEHEIDCSFATDAQA